MRKLVILLFSACLMLTGCSSKDSSAQPYSPKDTSTPTDVSTYTEPTKESLDSQYKGIEHVISAGGDETQIRKYVTQKYKNNLIQSQEEWDWDATVKTMRAQSEYWSVHQLVRSERAQVNAVGDSSASAVREMAYSVTTDLDEPARDVTCQIKETWKLEESVWKLDTVDDSECTSVLSQL